MVKRRKRSFGTEPVQASPDKIIDEPITISISGEDFKIDRIKLSDISAVYGRIRDNRIKALLRNSKAMGDHVLAEGMAHVAAIDPTQEDYWRFSQTPAGMTYIVWRCMARHNQGLTEDDVARLLEQEGGILDMLFAESGLTKPSEPADIDSEGENRDPLLTFGGGDARKTDSNGLTASDESSPPSQDTP